jgi:putative NADPH-quinone reductase
MSLVILAHPNYDKSLANKTIIDALQTSNLELEVRNLHSLYPDYRINIKAEQEALLRHETIIFQCPFYWLNIPALLKLWFDEVFAYQFTYGSQGDKLKGKNFVPSFTVGASKEQYLLTGRHHHRIDEFCKNIEQTAYCAQMNYTDPICFYGTASGSEDEIRSKGKEHASKLVACLETLTIA